MASEHARTVLSAFLEYAYYCIFGVSTGIFKNFQNSVLFWTVDLNFTFVKIFGTVSQNFRWSKSPVCFWSSFELRKNGKSERPGKPKGRNFFSQCIALLQIQYLQRQTRSQSYKRYWVFKKSKLVLISLTVCCLYYLDNLYCIVTIRIEVMHHQEI